MIKSLIAAGMMLLASLMPSFSMTRNIATAPMGFYVANSPLGNDANDGLTAATPKEHYCVMLQELYKFWDFQWNQPYMFVRSGQLFNEMCSTGGTFVGIDAVIIAPYDPANPSSPGNIVPSPDFVRACLPPGCGSSTPAVQWCDSFGDLAIQIYYNATWSQCNHWNMVGGGAIVVHNVATVDIFGPQSTFSGTGSNDSAILADGPAIISVAAGMKINGSFGYPLTCNRDCNATISGHMDAVGSNILGWYGLYSGSHLNLGAAYSVSSSVIQGPSLVSGNSVVNLHGTAVTNGWSQPYGGQVCPGAYC